MLTISDFSRLTRVAAKTLRFYDEIDLFKPAHVDKWTGYRYYSPEQLPRLNRILALKALGLSLEQIKRMIDETLTAEEIRGMLRLKRAEIELELEEQQTRLAFVETKLKQIEKEGHLSTYDVILKQVESQPFASIREKVANFDAMKPFLARAFMGAARQIASNGAKPSVAAAIYHDMEYLDHDLDVEAGLTFEGNVPPVDGITIGELPTIQSASTIHKGAFSTIEHAYSALLEWINANRYKTAGASRELYLHLDEQDQANHITELQFPVTKA